MPMRQTSARKFKLSNVDRYGVNDPQSYQFSSNSTGDYNLNENYYDLRERRVIKDLTPKLRKICNHRSEDHEQIGTYGVENATNEKKCALNPIKSAALSSSNDRADYYKASASPSGPNLRSYLAYCIWLLVVILFSLASYSIYINFLFLSRFYLLKKNLHFRNLFLYAKSKKWIFLVFCVLIYALGVWPFSTDKAIPEKVDTANLGELVRPAEIVPPEQDRTAALEDQITQLESQFLSATQDIDRKMRRIYDQMNNLVLVVETLKQEDQRELTVDNVNELVGQAVNLFFNESTISRMVSKSIDEAVSQAIEKTADRAIYNSTDELVDKAVHESLKPVNDQLKTQHNQVNSILATLESMQSALQELEKKALTAAQVNEQIELSKTRSSEVFEREWYTMFERALQNSAIQKQLVDTTASSVAGQESHRCNGTSVSDNMLGKEPDYALANIGGHVVVSLTGTPPNVHWPSISPKKRVLNWLSGKMSFNQNPPFAALDPSLVPGNCWAFPGSQANFTVRLACPIEPIGFTVDHTANFIAPQPSSAPKSMRVYALVQKDGTLHRIYLHEFSYDIHALPSQTFYLSSDLDVQVYETYQLEILSNWGHSYTCLYRFRVHGKPTEKCQDLY